MTSVLFTFLWTASSFWYNPSITSHLSLLWFPSDSSLTSSPTPSLNSSQTTCWTLCFLLLTSPIMTYFLIVLDLGLGWWRYALGPGRSMFDCGVSVPLSSSPPYFMMQFLCLSLSSKYISYLFPQNQQKSAQNIYFIKCAVLIPVTPPFQFPLHKIQNPRFQLSCLSKYVHHMFIKPYTRCHLDLCLTWPSETTGSHAPRSEQSYVWFWSPFPPSSE